MVSTHPHTSRPNRVCLEEVKKAKALFSKGTGIPTSPTWHGSGEDCLPPNSCCHSVTPHNIYLPSKWWNQVFKQWRANQAFKRKRFLARESQKRTGESRRAHLRRRKQFDKTTAMWLEKTRREEMQTKLFCWSGNNALYPTKKDTVCQPHETALHKCHHSRRQWKQAGVLPHCLDLTSQGLHFTILCF